MYGRIGCGATAGIRTSTDYRWIQGPKFLRIVLETIQEITLLTISNKKDHKLLWERGIKGILLNMVNRFYNMDRINRLIRSTSIPAPDAC